MIILNNLPQVIWKLLQNGQFKKKKETGELIGNRNSNKISKISTTSQMNYLKTITNEHDQEIPKERYIFPQ